MVSTKGGDSRSLKDYGLKNLAVLHHTNHLQPHQTGKNSKVGVKTKRLKTSWNNQLFGENP
jgi:hypothetical protein